MQLKCTLREQLNAENWRPWQSGAARGLGLRGAQLRRARIRWLCHLDEMRQPIALVNLCSLISSERTHLK